MYGSPVSKDLNLPVQPPPMTSSGLLRYRSAPSTLLGEVCEDFLNPVPRAASPDPAADNVFSRFLADHQIRDKPPAPPQQQQHAPAAAHFPDTTAAMAASQQQMMFHSQQHQQQMAAVESGLYRTVSSGMEAPAAVAGAGGASSLIRQSSSPAGFLNHLNMDNGYGGMLRAGMGVGGFRNGATAAAAAADSPSGPGRLKGQLSFSSRQGSLMSQISEMGSEELGGSSPEGAGGAGRGFIPGYPMSSGWEDTSSLMSENLSGMKRPRDSSEPGQVQRPDAAVQPAQDVVGDGGAREVPPVRGRRALQDPRQARLRHAPAQHRRAGEEDKDQRANQEAPGARAQHGQANQHFRPAGFGRRLHQGSPEAGQGAEREPRQVHLLGEQEPAVLRLKAPGARPQLTPCKTPRDLRRQKHLLEFGDL